VGLFGKIPAERDFVRVNAGAFLRAGLDRWFQEGVEHLQRERTQLPAEPTRFLLCPTAGAPPFAGVFAASQDAVGRAFPVAIFAVLDPPPARVDLPLLPAQLASFWDASARLAEATREIAPVDLAVQAGALTSTLQPDASPLDLNALLLRSNSSELCAAVGGSPDAAAYALTTVIAACSRTNTQPPDPSGRVLALDCPALNDGLRAFWLDLVRRHLDAKVQMPSSLWTRDSGRLLVALGPAPSLMLAYLADPDHKSTRRWPLRTSSQAARAGALERLSPAKREVLVAVDAPLSDVLSVFSDG
jgi:type VI secretion system protein ImpM